jgi:GLPGLI family protein
MKYYFFLLCSLLTYLANAQTIEVIYDEYYNNNLVTSKKQTVVYAQNNYSVQFYKDNLKQYPVISTYNNYNTNEQVKKAEVTNLRTIYSQPVIIDNGYNFKLTDSIKKIKGYNCKLATTIVNSNQISIWYTNELKVNGSPKNLGASLGLVLEIVINNNSKTTAKSINKIKGKTNLQLPLNVDYLSPIDFDYEIWKARFNEINVFKFDTINFSNKQSNLNEVKKYANGTVITKKIKIPELHLNDQVFIDLTTFSQGDAYDRTGSVFLIIPDENKKTFENALQQGITTLPSYETKKQEEYRGFVINDSYTPALEIMRFFTPFGVQKFNHIELKNKKWQNEVYYRQDISELSQIISNKEVIIGIYIGNYDSNGHNVNLNLSIHKGNTNTPKYNNVIPLFNTVNILEMAGQNYATLFENEEGLKVKFNLTSDLKNVKLRYIATGHGGWSEGDEFLQKKNSIYLDDNLVYDFIPWRTDCGSYRSFNPASGNFENGLSSSDLSRANWCPGTITNPIYIDLGDLKKGEHKITIKIPQGPKQGESFSFWNVSGVLLGN